MTKSRTVDGSGALQFGEQDFAVTYSLTVVHDRRVLSAFGTVSAEIAALQAAQNAQDTHLVLSSGDHEIKIVITRHTHGLPAEFKSDGDIPHALRP